MVALSPFLQWWSTTNDTKEKIPFIDLFCGGGGAARGYFEAGFQPLLGVDIEWYALEAYKQNFPKTTTWQRDIATLRSEDIHRFILEKHGLEEIPLVIASPPCEPFTSANEKRRKTPEERIYEDPRGRLMLHAIRIIGDLEPNVFVIENVVPSISGETGNIIKSELKEVGFENVYFNVIEAKEHGVPSSRKRVFISNVRFSLPQRKAVKVKEAIKDLPNPRLPHGINAHEYVPTPTKYEEQIYKVWPGQSLMFFRGASKEFGNYTRLSWDMTAPTVMGKSRFIHPSDDRLLTPREHARLMSYPDHHLFLGTIDQQFNLVGESVPPLLTFEMGKIIEKTIGPTVFVNTNS